MKNSKVLALKYRPVTLDDLVGQETVAKTIFNSIKLNKTPNAYLFHGIRGTGKTSIARIIAKGLNCKNGIEKLCKSNFCENCQSITDSNHLDIIEQDCATATGIDSVRDLIEFCRYPPSSAKYKVLILDEIQAMSKAGAQSLLKILEEPPEYVRFIFCTTEIKKILITMLSRCTRFDLSRIKFDTLFDYIKKINLLEAGNISDDALKLICKCSQGSVRDSLSLLDRALLSCSENERMDLKKAKEIFGHFDKSILVELFDCLFKGEELGAINIYRKLYNTGIEPKIFLEEFLEVLYFLKNISSIKLDGNNFNINDNEIRDLQELSSKIDVKSLMLYWHLTIKVLEEINVVSNQNISVEMFLIRLVHVRDIRSNIDLKDEKNYKDEIIFKNKTIKENTSQNFNKHEGMIVDQIKNISQEEKIRAAENDKNDNKINSFDDLIVMANNKKEMDLKYNLETNVNLVSFEKNRIKISFNEKLNTDFIKILTAKLLEWTGERWIITLTKEKGILSKKESKKRDNELLKSKFKTSEQYLKIKNLFKDAVFSDIEDETDE